MGHGPSHHKAQLQLRPHPLSAPALLLPLPSWNSLLSNSQDLDPCCGHCFREADQKSQRGVFPDTVQQSRRLVVSVLGPPVPTVSLFPKRPALGNFKART